MPGRAFPGVVFQGDSLQGLIGEVREIQELIAGRDLAAANEAAGSVADYLLSVQAGYESAMAEHSLELPYFK